jgi:hypothetical protein
MRGSEKELPVDLHEFTLLFLGEHEHIALGSNVHLCPRCLEAIMRYARSISICNLESN